MGLNFGKHSDVVFGHAPLVSVLCQIKFSPVLSLMTPVGIAGFQTAIRSQYPTLLPPEQTTDIALGPQSVGIQQSAPLWKMVDPEKKWAVGISADFVSLETPSYSSISEFLERLNFVLRALHRTIRPSDSLRVGLRKVNAIKSGEYGNSTENLSEVIRPELLGPLSVKGFPADISGSFSQLQFVDGYNQLVIRYGLGSSDGEEGFVLDLDYYTEQPYAVDGDAGLRELLLHFSEGMTSFFHWAVEDSYKSRLDPRPRVDRGAGA